MAKKTIPLLTEEDVQKNIDKHNTDFEAALALRIKEAEAEKNRVKNMACPVCKSKKKEHVLLSFKNRPLVYGGRNAAAEQWEYYICEGCGVHYTDINKPKQDVKQSRRRNARRGE